MGRAPRAFDDGLFHLASRASDIRYLFVTNRDRTTFLKRLAETFARHELRVIEYMLMGSHYHLIVHTPDLRISTALQQLHTWYSRNHNRRHGRSAHLFRAHFMAFEITSDADLLGTCRYLALNPVRAGLVKDPFAWPWSSVRAHAGLARPAIPLDQAPIRAAFENRPDWQDCYAALIKEAAEGES